MNGTDLMELLEDASSDDFNRICPLGLCYLCCLSHL